MKKIMFDDRFCLTNAVIDGTKTMTRRIIGEKIMKGAYDYVQKIHGTGLDMQAYLLEHSPYKAGDVVAIAQQYKKIGKEIEEEGLPLTLNECVIKHAGYNNKMFVRADLMPHRIRITNIKVERLQDISHEDCLKEGILYQDGYFCGYKVSAPNMAFGAMTAQQAFAALIDKVCGKGTWDSNPYVFVYEFELLKGGKK